MTRMTTALDGYRFHPPQLPANERVDIYIVQRKDGIDPALHGLVDT